MRAVRNVFQLVSAGRGDTCCPKSSLLRKLGFCLCFSVGAHSFAHAQTINLSTKTTINVPIIGGTTTVMVPVNVFGNTVSLNVNVTGTAAE